MWRCACCLCVWVIWRCGSGSSGLSKDKTFYLMWVFLGVMVLIVIHLMYLDALRDLHRGQREIIRLLQKLQEPEVSSPETLFEALKQTAEKHGANLRQVASDG